MYKRMAKQVSQQQKPKAIRIFEKAFINFRRLNQISGQQQNPELHTSGKRKKQTEIHED